MNVRNNDCSGMKIILYLLWLIFFTDISHAQTTVDSLSDAKTEAAGDDPSQFFTRVELFNELQHHKDETTEYNLNQTTFRTIVKIGNRFTTRLDLPFIYNSFPSVADYQQFGLSDISFRLLGYKFLESMKSAFTASIEISLNTAKSPLIGLGKNIILPVLSYTTSSKGKRLLYGFILQEALSFSGDAARNNISYTKFQPLLIKIWSGKMWTVLAPELYLDYVNGKTAMNLEGRIAYAPVHRINIWGQVGGGIFGDFLTRYQWGGEVGCRYFFLRNTIFKRKNSK
jgi:hypothetical protein